MRSMLGMIPVRLWHLARLFCLSTTMLSRWLKKRRKPIVSKFKDSKALLPCWKVMPKSKQSRTLVRPFWPNESLAVITMQPLRRTRSPDYQKASKKPNQGQSANALIIIRWHFWITMMRQKLILSQPLRVVRRTKDHIWQPKKRGLMHNSRKMWKKLSRMSKNGPISSEHLTASSNAIAIRQKRRHRHRFLTWLKLTMMPV